MTDELHVSDQWRSWRQRVDLDAYDARWDRLASQGEPVHGEAAFVERLVGGGERRRVLDAGCGTGRVGVELARRGWTVVGVDNDADMVALAAGKPVNAEWMLADLATVEVEHRFDVVVLAGDVLLFVEPGREHLVVANLAAHLAPGGRLVSGQSLPDPGMLDRYDGWARAAGLEPAGRYATWDGDPHQPSSDYAVSVHVLPN